MNEYELKVYEELEEWKRSLFKKSKLIKRLSKQAQEKINDLLPEKAQKIVSDTIKNLVKICLFGSELTTKEKNDSNESLKEKDEKVKEKINTYRKTAVIEGAGTGAGGVLLGFADFPLLLSIKIKFLFEAASIYGFDTSKYEERLFILHVFQLAFSSDEKRRETFAIIDNWDEEKEQLMDMDWHVFQQEYRDYIDFAKMLQLLPGFGAVFGAYANYQLLEHLGEVAMNCYRLRILKSACTN